MRLLCAPFVGVEALDAGLLRKHHLRSLYVAIFPGVYLPRGVHPTFRQRAEAAWLWSQRRGVLSGLTASRLHGSQWIDDSLPIELICCRGRSAAGIRCSRDSLAPGEQELRASLPVTTAARTAVELGRRGNLGEAVARLDALGNATGITSAQIAAVADAHPGMRGVRGLRRALAMYDAGAQSPKETWLGTSSAWRNSPRRAGRSSGSPPGHHLPRLFSGYAGSGMRRVCAEIAETGVPAISAHTR